MVVQKFRVWDTVKKAMSEVQAIVYAEERKAYAEFMRGLEKLRKINGELVYDDSHKLVEGQVEK